VTPGDSLTCRCEQVCLRIFMQRSASPLVIGNGMGDVRLSTDTYFSWGGDSG